MPNTPNHDASFEKALRAFLRKQRLAAEGCPDPALLSAYYERALDGDEARALDEHLAACADCQAELALLARLDPDATPAEPDASTPAVELTPAQLAEPQGPAKPVAEDD